MSHGWRKDKWGLSWQITPSVLTAAIADPDRAAAKRAFEAMMGMRKIDIAATKRLGAADAPDDDPAPSPQLSVRLCWPGTAALGPTSTFRKDNLARGELSFAWAANLARRGDETTAVVHA
jgi:hypothetical protein